MEYLIPIFLCLLFSVQHDQTSGVCILGKSHRSKIKYKFIFIWLVLLSAFQYRIGYDIPIYMDDYDSNKYIGLSDVFDHVRYRPGWLFLQYICHQISDDFVVLKIIQTLFINYCVYKYLSRYSRYWYLTLFFYILYPYGQLNFGAMRQAFAVGFFLLSIPYLEERNTKKESLIALVKYGCLIYLATLFHTSAFFLYLVPFFKLFVTSIKRMQIVALVVVIVSVILSQISSLNMILYSLVQSSEVMEENSRYYLTSGDYEGTKKGIALIMSYIPISFAYICLYLNRNLRDSRYKVIQMLLLAYIVMATLNLSIPIFYRFNDYFVFAYIVLIPMAIYNRNLFNKYSTRTIGSLKLLLFAMYILYPVNHLVAVHPSFGFPGYRIYYPYYSVFNPKVDPARSKTINF